MANRELIEEPLLRAADALLEQAQDQATKIIAELFKSAVLKPYLHDFRQELSEGAVHRKTMDKAIDYCSSDICASIRQLPKLTDGQKEEIIQHVKQMKGSIKETVEKILMNRGVEILE